MCNKFSLHADVALKDVSVFLISIKNFANKWKVLLDDIYIISGVFVVLEIY